MGTPAGVKARVGLRDVARSDPLSYRLSVVFCLLALQRKPARMVTEIILTDDTQSSLIPLVCKTVISMVYPSRYSGDGAADGSQRFLWMVFKTNNGFLKE